MLEILLFGTIQNYGFINKYFHSNTMDTIISTFTKESSDSVSVAW